jgi:hypothetical protein
VLRARSQFTTRLDLPPLADVTAKPTDILVIHVLDVISAELANLAARTETSASATAQAASATGSKGTASTAFSALTRALGTAKAGAPGLPTVALALRSTEAGTA